MRAVLASDKSKNLAGTLIFIIFTFIAIYKFSVGFELFFALLVIREMLVAYFLFTRYPGVVKIPIWQNVIAYVSSAVPLTYFSPDLDLSIGYMISGKILMIIGFTLSTLALIDLGRSFGVSPQKRGKTVRNGTYKFLKHPMYVGYMVMEIGMVAMNFDQNIAIFVVSLSLYLTRISLENAVLKNPQPTP